MPLSFPSKNRGNIAFGFFHIETDLLLLEHLFFFAADFCDIIAKAAESGQMESTMPAGYIIDDPAKMGNLAMSIQGAGFEGFIGEVYRRYPFPRDPDDFAQNPRCAETRPEMETLLMKWARPISIAVSITDSGAAVGEYRFDASGFNRLIRYVEQGGYPRWRDEKPPAYVKTMCESLRRNHPSFFLETDPAR
jgi:hypothetical protein